jgi:hypothetical protein
MNGGKVELLKTQIQQYECEISQLKSQRTGITNKSC